MSQHKFTGDRSDMAHRIKTEMAKGPVRSISTYEKVDPDAPGGRVVLPIAEPVPYNYPLPFCVDPACPNSDTLHARTRFCGVLRR